MNRYDFTQPGGFPFDQGVMAFIQNCIATAAAAASLAGPLAILSGCVVTGGSVGDGMVVINGEILPFIGGIAEANVRIQEIGTPVVYQDGTPRTTKITRTAMFGNGGGTALLWANFKRNVTEGVLARLERLEWLSAPDLVAGGGMRLWRKPVSFPLPAGWREVVDWKGRLLQGYDETIAEINDVGISIGENAISITAANIPRPAGLVTSYDGPHPKPGDGGGNPLLYPTAISGATTAPTPKISFTPKVRTIMFIEPIPDYIT